jgi:hypothetical protein
MPLFHPKVLKEAMSGFTFPPALQSARLKIIQPWLQGLTDGKLDQAKETQLHGDFLARFFKEILGYRGRMDGVGAWELSAEQGTASGGGLSMDAALGFFEPGGGQQVLVPIELKGARQLLDQPVGRRLSPVEQAWNYANHTPGCRWILVSNYRETRLYSTARTPAQFETFPLQDLADPEALKRFYFLLSRENLLPATPAARSRVDDLLVASANKDAEITAALYAEYREVRAALHTHLKQVHSNLPPDTLIAHTQTILDRVLFMAFAEDRGLLPPETLKHAATTRDRYHRHPIWENLLAVFQWIDEGHDEDPHIPGYDGGLFRHNQEIEALQVSDAMCKELARLGRYDYKVDVTEDVLGHIFEQSVSDLEAMRAEAVGELAPAVVAQPSKRKLEGVFYTPPFVTRFLVEETIGVLVREAWNAVLERHRPDEAKSRKDSRERWEAVWVEYRVALAGLRVLDPACGSGAFLIAAYDRLAHEYSRVDRELAAMRGPLGDAYYPATILTRNLFGVDLNGESVEITKLALWLKTAAGGRRLTDLDRNIRCGNSVIADPELDPRAFDWSRGRRVRDLYDAELTPYERDTDACWREGFDVVIGNPPYVRQERLGKYKPHWEQASQVYSGTADLFVYFFERGLSVLKPGGRLGFISSNSWLRSAYATPLRAWLKRNASIETLIDLGDNRVFADAPDVYPVLTVARKAAAPQGHLTQAASFARGEGVSEFAQKLADRSRDVDLTQEPDSGWQLGGGAKRRLLDKL